MSIYHNKILFFMQEADLLSRQFRKVRQAQDQHISSHCRLAAGDLLGEYQVGSELGRGRFATVWEVISQKNDKFAIKVYRSGERNAEYYRNEAKILNKIFDYVTTNHDASTNIIGYMGTFIHEELGPDYAPNQYPCIRFQLAGDHLGRLIRYFKRQYNEGLPLITVKKIMHDIFNGLAYLHKCDIIHTDIKPSNLLMNKRVEDITKLDDIQIFIGDLGSSTSASDIFSHNVGTDGYIAPEIVLEMQYTSAIDIWAAFSVCYGLITGDHLFDVYGEDDVDYGEDIKENIQRGSSKEEATVLSTGGDDSDSSGSESLSERTVNYNTLLLMEKVLGPAPKEFTQWGREYYNARGKLKNNPNIEHMPISKLLLMNYQLDESVCNEIEEFLLCGLKYLPEARINTTEALIHPFLQYIN